MKELSIEEKAKRFDEALGKARRYYDEYKTRDNILYVEDIEDMFPELQESKESNDEKIRKRIIHALHGDVLDMEETTEAIAWLKDRIHPQPKQEWSEEDNLQLQDAIDICKSSGHTITSNWLKSLRPQTTWKPSKEQIEALNLTINVGHVAFEDEIILKELLEQLKVIEKNE